MQYLLRLAWLLMRALHTVVNVLLAALVGWFAVGPNGVVSLHVQRIRQEREDRELIGRYWGQISSEGGLISDGGPHARQLVEFGDYQCQYCAQLQGRLDTLLQRYPDITLRYRHLPLPGSPYGKSAALASICAEAADRFPEFHRILFSSGRWTQEPDWVRNAVQAGVSDTAAFARCMRGIPAGKRLLRDQKLARSLGIEATPTVIGLNGRVVGAGSPGTLSLAARGP